MEAERWDGARDGALSERALRVKLERRGYRVARYAYPPGTVFPDHRHDVDKIDAVISGRFRMTIGGRSVLLEAGDCLAVPRGTVHSAEVVGEEPVVSLDATRDAGPTGGVRLGLFVMGASLAGLATSHLLEIALGATRPRLWPLVALEVTIAALCLVLARARRANPSPRPPRSRTG